MAAGPSSRASTMSVAKIRTASPNRVTIVTSASRISGDAPGRTGRAIGVSSGATSGAGAVAVIGRRGSLRARRGVSPDRGQLGIGQGAREPGGRPGEALGEPDPRPEAEDARRPCRPARRCAPRHRPEPARDGCRATARPPGRSRLPARRRSSRPRSRPGTARRRPPPRARRAPPSTAAARSSTWMKSRVCAPSPWITIGSPVEGGPQPGRDDAALVERARTIGVREAQRAARPGRTSLRRRRQ